MIKVTFCNENKKIYVKEETTILEAARQSGVIVESPCNGVGVCGKCKVKLDPHSYRNVSQDEKHRLSKDEELQGFVLSCVAQIKGDITVETTGSQHDRDLKILDQGKTFDISLDSFIHKEFHADDELTKVFGGENLLGSEAGDTTKECFGAVVDIGTTTLVVSLVDLNNGDELDSESSLNPQAIHAQDVLSRIKLASEKNGLMLMHSELITEINHMIDALTRRNAIDFKRIYEVVFSGNTCMLHLASYVNPFSLGRFPYRPETSGAVYLKASAHGLKISEFGVVYLPPIISSYVGADITSGVLASQLHERKGITLFVDIGTNGEMVIGCRGELSATSTAAGPAFEGMNITYGMRASAGAIEYFNVDHEGGITVKTIGDIEAKGICGSGLLDIVGELVTCGVIRKSGKFIEPESEAEGVVSPLQERLVRQEGKIVFKITDKIVLTQKDVRQVQLAKGAIRAGIEFLLRNKNINASDVDKVLIAGSFGYHLRAKSLINIGLLPAKFAGKIEFIGNTSKSGGYAFLLNQSYRKRMTGLVQKIEVIELANDKDFDQVFINCLSF